MEWRVGWGVALRAAKEAARGGGVWVVVEKRLQPVAVYVYVCACVWVHVHVYVYVACVACVWAHVCVCVGRRTGGALGARTPKQSVPHPAGRAAVLLAVADRVHGDGR
eukprot:668704-Prymnesium_polylepis.1